MFLKNEVLIFQHLYYFCLWDCERESFQIRICFRTSEWLFFKILWFRQCIRKYLKFRSLHTSTFNVHYRKLNPLFFWPVPVLHPFLRIPLPVTFPYLLFRKTTRLRSVPVYRFWKNFPYPSRSRAQNFHNPYVSVTFTFPSLGTGTWRVRNSYLYFGLWYINRKQS